MLIGFMEDDAGIVDDSEGLKAFAPFFVAALRNGFKQLIDKKSNSSDTKTVVLNYDIAGRLSYSTLHLEHRQSHLVIGVFEMMHGLLKMATAQPLKKDYPTILSASSSSYSESFSGSRSFDKDADTDGASGISLRGLKHGEMLATTNVPRSTRSSVMGSFGSQSIDRSRSDDIILPSATSTSSATCLASQGPEGQGEGGVDADDAATTKGEGEGGEADDSEPGPSSKKRKLAPHSRRGRGGVSLFISRR
jgi:hypothetical protein